MSAKRRPGIVVERVLTTLWHGSNTSDSYAGWLFYELEGYAKGFYDSRIRHVVVVDLNLTQGLLSGAF